MRVFLSLYGVERYSSLRKILIMNRSVGLLTKWELKSITVLTLIKKKWSIWKQSDRIFKTCSLFFLFSAYAIPIYIEYNNYERLVEKNLHQTTISIENILNNNFDVYKTLIENIAKHIISHIDAHGGNDLQFIHSILKNISDEANPDKLLSFSFFDWVNADGLQLINSIEGIAKSPRNVADTLHVIKAKEKPGTLQLAPPHIGKGSGSWVIPASFGIKSSNGTYQGAITWGFKIYSLNNIVAKKIPDESFSFVVLDEDYNLVIKSLDNNISDRSQFYRDSLKKFNPSIVFDDGYLDQPVVHNTLKYTYYKKMGKYPYIVLAGYDQEIKTKKVWRIILPSIGEFLCIILFLFTFFYMYRKKYTETANASNKAKQLLFQRTIQQLRWDIELIYQHTSVLLKYLKKELKIKIPKEKQSVLINRIQIAALSLQQFSITNFDMSFVNVEELIKEAIIVHAHNAFIRNVYFTDEIMPNIPPFYANELGLKQIIIGIMSQSLDHMRLGGNIKISAFVQKNDIKEFLNITFFANRFEFFDKSMTKTSEQFSTKLSDGTDLINFDIDTIMKLVKLHNATYQLENHGNKGRTVILKFPYN